MRTTICLALALPLLACASAGRNRPPAGPPPVRPQPRSSIAAVLDHRADLGLTDEQAGRLQELDDQLARDNATLRTELRMQARPDGQSAAAKSPGPGSGTGANDGSGSGAGGGMGGGHHGGRGGAGGGSHQKQEAAAPTAAQRHAAALQHLDDNDTAAYFAAEAVLTDAQKDPARDFASRYREELCSWREAMHDRGEPDDL